MRRTIGLGELFERDWGRSTLDAADLVEAIRGPRARIAGLSLDRPRLMGIVNVTPDSFSDGGRHNSTEAAIAHGSSLWLKRAPIFSTWAASRPGRDPRPSHGRR